MKIRWKALVIAVLIPLAGGALSGYLSRSGTELYAAMQQPPLSPPGWVFPVVWTVLYTLMGLASYFIWVRREDPRVPTALRLYAAQLGFNLLWPVFFFRFGLYPFAFFWLVSLWLLILVTLCLFARLSRPAGLLLLPYLLWVSFAAYLNLGVWLLNAPGSLPKA